MTTYIIKPGTWGLIASYPHVSQGRLIVEQKFIQTPTNEYKLSKETTFLRICHIVPYKTTRLNFFTSADLVFIGIQFLDLNVKKSNLYAFADAGWYGFRKQNYIFVVTPENISSLNIKRPRMKTAFVPFENMGDQLEYRQSFEDWLEEIGYE